MNRNRFQEGILLPIFSTHFHSSASVFICYCFQITFSVWLDFMILLFLWFILLMLLSTFTTWQKRVGLLIYVLMCEGVKQESEVTLAYSLIFLIDLDHWGNFFQIEWSTSLFRRLLCLDPYFLHSNPTLRKGWTIATPPPIFF